jgi:hypothetical protein
MEYLLEQEMAPGIWFRFSAGCTLVLRRLPSAMHEDHPTEAFLMHGEDHKAEWIYQKRATSRSCLEALKELLLL